MSSPKAAAALVLAAFLVAGCGSGSATASAAPGSPTAAASPHASPATSASPTRTVIPAFDHVYMIVMENEEDTSVVGSNSAPYINSLVARYGLAGNYFAQAHPSQPNYIALTSGGLQGTSTNDNYDLNVPNLFDQVEAAGRTWRVYAQSNPGNCFTGASALPVADGPGLPGDYARKHNPAISYTSISRNPARCANITGLAGFDPSAADFELIVPNQINDMHSSSVKVGDDFLRAFVPLIIDSPAFANSALFLVWEEGSTDLGGGGGVAMIAATPGMPPGSRDTGYRTHYSTLRTIELAWGLPFLGEAESAEALDFPW
jgi:phosphatidylinositol-3-phosphatase